MKSIAFRGIRAVATLLFGALLIPHAIERFELPTRLLGFSLAPVTTAMTLTVLAATVLALLLPQRLRRPDWLSQLAIWLGLLALVMVVPFTFIAVNFGYADFETVTIMASDVPVSPLCQGCCPLLYFSLIFRWAG